jgi:uncharacterized protein YndB with AHSA1/START domain
MPDITHHILIEAPATTIFPLVATGAGLSQWWAEDVIQAPDGSVELGFFNRATVYRLRPQTQLAPTRATWVCETGKEWADTRLMFELLPRGTGTGLRFTHSGWRQASEYFVSCNTTWGGLLFRLRAVAQGRGDGPLFRKSGLAF